MIGPALQGAALDALTIGREFGPFGLILGYLFWEHRDMGSRLDKIETRLRGVEEAAARNDARIDVGASDDD